MWCRVRRDATRAEIEVNEENQRLGLDAMRFGYTPILFTNQNAYYE
jgi:hypothetical protein